MKVKVFDAEHEKDLEKDINEFLDDFEGDIVDIKYQVSIGLYANSQLYSFSALIMYEK